MESSALGFKTILLEARGLTGQDRADFLTRVCGNNTALREELESLLAFEAAVPSLLDDDKVLEKLKEKAGAFATIDFELQDISVAGDSIGDSIGPYRLVEVIGEGGMGVVYRAEQTAPLRRDVALKLIRRGLDTDRIVARFQSERQALARMDHPSIARVFDAGTSADGRPYFVMELVHGVPITDFCDRERLTVRERVDLMIAVCLAVQHAHQKGIIHRDLKPSNILVSRQDGVPVPKVIDFGIAKAIEATHEHTLLTREGTFIGTPDYMSPEQAGVIDVDADTRADVYALGVLLYELLSGRRPHQFERRTQEAVQAVLRESRPDKPSTAVSTRKRLTRATPVPDVTVLTAIVESRRTTADRLRRQLTGDLDNIVLRAMQKEPIRRYGSAEAFADDLRRYLGGLPVLARPDTWTYRTGKFVRRHAVGVGIAAAAVVLLVAFAVVMAVQSQRIARERDRALAAEQRATLEAQTSQQVSDFLVSLFEVSDPNKARGNTITAREILDRGAQRIESNLQGNRDVQARLMYTMGNVYKSLGLYDEAERLLQRALEERERSGANRGEIGNNLDNLGDTVRYRGKFAQAEPMLRRALEMRREAFGPESKEAAQSMNNLALVLEEQNKLDQAEQLEREALRIRRKVTGERSTETANSWMNLGIILRTRGRLSESEAPMRLSLEIRRERLGNDHPNIAVSLATLANSLAAMGRNEEAETLLREALAIYRKVLEKGSNRLDATINSLASVLQDLGKLDEAEANYIEALGIARTRDGGKNVEVAQDLNNLASLYEDRGEYAKAEGLMRESLALRIELRGEKSTLASTAMNNLGRVRFAQHDLAGAEKLLRQSLAIRTELGGERTLQAAGTHVNLARVLQAKGLLDEAEQEARQALDIGTKTLKPDHPNLLTTQLLLGRILLDRRRPSDAEPLIRGVLDARTRTLKAGDWQIGQAQLALGRTLLALGRRDDAEPLLRQSVELLNHGGKAQDPLKREAAAALAQASRHSP
jgi:eukaryotic-like serine/threonine-protein kinase